MTGVDCLLPARVKERLTTGDFGRRLYHYPRVDSTNRVAMELARAGEPEGTVVTADFQTHGKGRGGHTWSSPPGKDLLFSIVLRPILSLESLLPLTLVFSEAAAATLSVALETELEVKWPNDMITPQGKIGGVLAESVTAGDRNSIVVAGMGINVNARTGDFSPDLGGRAASMRSLSGQSWNRAVVLAAVLESLERSYRRFQAEGFNGLRTRYENRLRLRGKRVRFERSGVRHTGTVAGVEDDGALRVVAAGAGTFRLYSEEVEEES